MKNLHSFACVQGHQISAVDEETQEAIDLAGMCCPVCLGKLKGIGPALGPVFMLSPVQVRESQEAV